MTFCSEFITLNNRLNIPIRIKIQCWKIDPPISLIPTFMRSKRIVYLPTSAVIANRYIRVPRDKRLELDHLDEHFCTYNHNHTGLTLQTYSSWVRTSTHRQREEPRLVLRGGISQRPAPLGTGAAGAAGSAAPARPRGGRQPLRQRRRLRPLLGLAVLHSRPRLAQAQPPQQRRRSRFHHNTNTVTNTTIHKTHT